jgi:hypothetical protein
MTPDARRRLETAARIDWYCLVSPDDLAEALAEIDRLAREARGWRLECREVEQALGAALGYPWFKDDQRNFPGATEADGVCIGEHVPSTIAQEAGQAITKLRAALKLG